MVEVVEIFEECYSPLKIEVLFWQILFLMENMMSYLVKFALSDVENIENETLIFHVIPVPYIKL